MTTIAFSPFLDLGLAAVAGGWGLMLGRLGRIHGGALPWILSALCGFFAVVEIVQFAARVSA